MVQQFPNFKPITISDKPFVDKILLEFPPYSDFNFASLYNWNTDGKTEISLLNKNLVIKLKDYTSEQTTYSFIGINKPIETIQTLINFLQTKENSIIKLLPEHSIKDIQNLTQEFIIKEDPDQFDYIYDFEKLSRLLGPEYLKKRNLANRFERENDFEVVIIDSPDSTFFEQTKNLFQIWLTKKSKQAKDFKDELKAIANSHNLHHMENFFSVAVYQKDLLTGFAICEIIGKDSGMIHFEKTDPEIKGLSEYLMKKTAQYFQSKGVKYLNLQQDLGIPGLKKAKQLWRPVHYLKKYTLQPIK